jgi:hypothetical protein
MYSYAVMGLANAQNALLMSSSVGYEGSYQLSFQKAVAAWWIGRGKESRETFFTLAITQICFLKNIKILFKLT